ncbi:MAG: PQQ-like beta-propeller repeat protein [Verrucomicrobia bacterium]|nr:PQQ-like beta-propeller repeat protein [Verrucomicrobiota bacterium]
MHNKFVRVVSVRILFTAILSCWALAPLHSAEGPARYWPQWRGPLCNGVAPAGDPPVKWSETNNLRWKTVLPGYGTSTPIIWGNHVFVLSAMEPGRNAPAETPRADAASSAGDRPRGSRGGGGGFGIEKPTAAARFLVLAYDRASGKLLWQQTACEEVPHEGHHRDHGFASASPVTDGQHVYAYFGSRGLYCYDFAGKLQWSKRLGKMQTRNSFGEGSSPALHGDTLVILFDHEGDDFIVALDKRTGQELWRQGRDEPTGWTTPLVVSRADRTEVMVSATGKIRSYDFATGQPLWECAGMTANPIPCALVDGGLAYFISGFRGSALLAIKLGRRGDLTGTDAIAWRHTGNTPYAPSPLLYDGLLYFFSGNDAMLSCLDARTGQPHFKAERLAGIFGMYAAPVGAAGRIYIAGRDGKCAVLKHGPSFELLSFNPLDDRFDASPAVVDRELFLRGHRHLYCIAAPPGEPARQ